MYFGFLLLGLLSNLLLTEDLLALHGLSSTRRRRFYSIALWSLSWLARVNHYRRSLY